MARGAGAPSDAEERRLRSLRRIAWFAGAMVVACVALSGLALALRPRQFSTHRDAIGYELARRGVGYEQIYINRGWPDTLTDEYYGANLEVLLPSGRSAVGRLECKVRRTRCMFSVASLGVVREPLPELVEAGAQPEWMRWVEQVAARLGVRG
jgi:hypothetical protein